MSRLLLGLISFFPVFSLADSQSEIASIKKLAGCYLVDYSYSETESLLKGYTLDPRVYDSSQKFSVKEWIKVVKESENEVRLQHFLFATNKSGEVIFKMRHHGEIWQYRPQYFYAYEGLGFYQPSEQKADWLRIVTSLDDGLRYQCPGSWDTSGEYPKFQCEAFAPIPGRETRDMGRKDYNSMHRQSDIIHYGQGWLERQSNIKVRSTENQSLPIAKEVGKHWYVPLPDSECEPIKAWADDRQPFWNLLEKAWSMTLDGTRRIHQSGKFKDTTSYARIAAVREHHYKDLLEEPKNQKKRDHILEDLLEVLRASITLH